MRYFRANNLFKLFLIIIIFSASSCTLGRFIWYNFADITDYKIFPSRPLKASTPFYHFQEGVNNPAIKEVLKIEAKGKGFNSFEDLVSKNKSVAFLIIRNDSILYENYFNDYADSSIVPSFSMAKSVISMLLGIAKGEGFIKDESQPITDYLPELKNKGGFEKITLKDLLQMESGIKSSENYYSPFSHVAKLYYGRNQMRMINNLKTEEPPEKGFKYKSINSLLLGLILERATGKHITDYLQEKIWTPLQMEFDASWSLDKKKNGLEKTFCCLNVRARDFAKLGRLYLNKGNWNGKQIVPIEWVRKSTTNSPNNSVWWYGYQWWHADPNDGDFYADGFLGQFIYVYPAKNIIMVRLGKRIGKVKWIQMFQELAEKL